MFVNKLLRLRHKLPRNCTSQKTRMFSCLWRTVLCNNERILLPRVSVLVLPPSHFLSRCQSCHKQLEKKSSLNASFKTVSTLKDTVCRKFSSYFYRLEDWLLQDVDVQDPEIFMSFNELLDTHGFNLENHTVYTEDGYILTLHRVSLKNALNTDTTKKPVVLLVHGFQCSSIHWFLNEKHKTLPKILALQGFDCWLINLRGGPNAKKHSKMSHTNPNFWDFSWHEMGCFDIPASIDYILDHTGSESLYYIGHSMGASVFFVGMSEKQEYCKKIKTMIAFGPAVFPENVRNKPVKWVVAPVASFLGKWKLFRQKEIFQQEFASIAARFSPPVRCATKLGGYLVFKYGKFFGGIGSEQMKANQICQLGRNWPHTTSAKVLYHGMQCIASRKFQKYDYGKEENLVRYGESKSPAYDLGRVVCPVATFYANDDDLCTFTDVQKLSEILPNSIGNFGISQKHFNHSDFIFGKDAHQLVYPQVLKILKTQTEAIYTSVI